MTIATLTVHEETTLCPRETRELGCRPTLDHFQHYAGFSNAQTRLMFVKVREGGRFLGLAPIAILFRRMSTDLLRSEMRRWLGPLIGWSSRRTTCLVDSAFLGYEYTSPFFCVDPQDRQRVRDAIVRHLQARRDVQIVWITEPGDCVDSTAHPGFDPFPTLPLSRIDLAGHQNLESFLAAGGKKRRKNWRADRRKFDENGGRFEHCSAPIPAETLREMHECLLASSRHNGLYVPYEDLLNDRSAFLTQNQQAIIARSAGRVAGFFSWFANGRIMQQCHGGFDHLESQRINAYPNLINQAIEFALQNGFEAVSLGPLNNETKRRAATSLLPFISSVWCRDPVTRWFLRHVFQRNFQVYYDAAVPKSPGERLA